MVSQAATLRKFSRIGVAAVILVCSVALAGWLLGIPVLASIVPGWPRMALIVLFCFLLCGAAILELTLPVRREYFLWARIAAASIVLAISAYTLIDFVATGGLSGGGSASGAVDLFGPRLGRPSPATAFNFLVVAIALMMPQSDRHGRIYSGLIAVGLAVTGFDFVGYAYGIAALSRGPTISTMSLPTMISFVLLLVSALLARPQAGWTTTIFAHNSGGVTARRLLPTVLLLPFIMNGMVLLAYHSRPFEAPFGFAILAVATSIGLCVATIMIADWLTRHENERRQGQELLEAIVDNSMAVIYVKDLAGRYLMANRRFLDIYHLDRQTLTDKTDYDIFSKFEADSFRSMDEQVVRAGCSMTGEEIASQPDGFHTFVSIKAPLRNAAGQPYAVFGISTDITDRKRSEKALAASEERTRLIVETALDAVISIDRDGAITGWNSQAKKIFGWTREEVLGRRVEETIMPERYRDAHRRGLAHYLTTGEARVLNKRIELAALDRNGREFPVELSITPIRSGDTIAFSAFLRDITERKNTEARLQTQLERLASAPRSASPDTTNASATPSLNPGASGSD